MSAPPLTLTPSILQLAVDVAERVGQLKGLSAERPEPRLRRKNRIKTVHATTAIEGNTLGAEHVTAVLDGKRVLGPRREVLEIENAIAAYERAPQWNPWSATHVLAAHRALMHGLIDDAGHWRQRAVGILHGQQGAHVAPPHRRVPDLMRDVLRWGSKAPLPIPIKACVVHYEIQFIHPFSDGNGRIGRLWQHVVLLQMSPAFQWLPVESVIKTRQREYYAALQQSDRAGDCGRFVEFSLSALRDALDELIGHARPERETASTRIEAARTRFGRSWFSRAEYLSLHKRLSTATASRDLRDGVAEGVLRKRGDRRLTRYRFTP